MKNFLFLLTLLSALALSSCTKIIYTHDQVLGSYKTKEEVLRRFGNPEQKKIGAEGEEWLYTYESSTPFTYRDAAPVTTTTTEVTEFGQYAKYVVFNFDKQGTVINYQAEGVDFAKRKPNPAGTIALAATGAVIVAATIAVLVVHSWSIDWNTSK